MDVVVFPGGGGWLVEVEGLAMGISCNPIWDGGDAPGEILTGVNRETSAEAGGREEAASPHLEGKQQERSTTTQKIEKNIEDESYFRRRCCSCQCGGDGILN